MKQFWQENKGSISTFAILSIIAVLMILFMSVNIGNLYAKKNLVEDTAVNLALVVLNRQIAPTDTQLPQNFADALQDSVGLTGAETPVITFGILNIGHPTLPDGFYPFGDPNTGVATNIDPQNPTYADILIDDYSTQDFAVQIDIQYNATPLGSFISFSTISLTQTGTAATNFSALPIVPENNDQCCCQLAEELNPGYVSKNSLTSCWYRKTTSFMPYIPCLIGATDFCDDYYDCHGRFFENLFTGQLFSSFLDQYKCWLPDFLARVQLVRDTIRTVSENVWNGTT